MNNLILAKKDSEQKIISILHFCRKAGKLKFGVDASIQSLKFHKSKLILVSSDISEGSLNKILNHLKNNKTIAVMFSNKNDISLSLNIRETAVFSINDKNFSNGILKVANEEAQVEQNLRVDDLLKEFNIPLDTFFELTKNIGFNFKHRNNIISNETEVAIRKLFNDVIQKMNTGAKLD